MGNAGAQFFGLPEAFIEIKDSVAGLLKHIDTATKATTSGNFYSFDGSEMKY
jgi:norsolorinic acid ketoreductase